MEQWEQDLNTKYSKYERNVKLPFDRVKKIVRDILRKERERDKIQELVDYVKKSKSNTDILINYCDNQRKNFCNRTDHSEELLDELGIKVYEREAMILYYLEKYFNPPKETGK